MKRMNRFICVLLSLALCLSLAACGGGKESTQSKFTEADYMGLWEYEEYYLTICIADDGTWYCDEDNDGVGDVDGKAKFSGGSLRLLNGDGSEYAVLTMQDINTLTDGEGDKLLRTEKSDLPENEPEANTVVDDFVGTWQFDDGGELLEVSPDGTWEVFDTDGSSLGSGLYEFANEALTLLDDGGEPLSSFHINGADSLMDNDGYTLSRSEASMDSLTFDALPSAKDELTETVALPNISPEISVKYPSTLYPLPDTMDGMVQFNAVNSVDGDEHSYCNITVALLGIGSNYDSYMTQGRDAAMAGMITMLNDYNNLAFGDKLIKSIGTDFEDGDQYYESNDAGWDDEWDYYDPDYDPNYYYDEDSGVDYYWDDDTGEYMEDQGGW